MKFHKRKHDTDCAHDGRVKKFMLQDKLCQDSKYCKIIIIMMGMVDCNIYGCE